MKLPSRIVDISATLDNETVLDPPFMRPKIDYKTGKENAWMLLEGFPGLKAEDLPDGEGWAFELVNPPPTTAPTWMRPTTSSPRTSTATA